MNKEFICYLSLKIYHIDSLGFKEFKKNINDHFLKFLSVLKPFKVPPLWIITLSLIKDERIIIL